MHVHWSPTGEYYRRIVAAPDMAEKERLYRECFGPLFEAMSRSHIPTQEDVIDSARAFNLLLPEDLIDTPEALRRLESADAWAVGGAALAEGAACFAPCGDHVPLTDVTGWLLLMNPAKADPANRGYTGFQFPGHAVGIFDMPNEYNLPRLPGLIVHELHHLVRLGLFPWNRQQPYSVADYVVLEGMAESFSAQLYGQAVVGYYATDLSADDLATASAVVRDGLHEKGDIRGYIFGDHFAEQWHFPKIGMPPFGGYAVGYQIVQAYLRRTGGSVEDATFVPSEEIVGESGYFE